MTSRTRWLSAAWAAGLAMAGPVGAAEPAKIGVAEPALETHTAASAAKLITELEGKAALVVIYASSCVRSRAAFPTLLKVAERHAGKAAVLAFGVDRTDAPLRRFLEGKKLPFPARWIRPWQKGELVKAFGPLGVNIAPSLDMPIMAVFGRDGKIQKQWSPATDLKEVEAALQSAE